MAASGRGRYGRYGWQTWEPSVPIAVEGGLTARSTRGAIGTSWWSKRFIAVVESFGAGGRLTRGRAYARKGQVLSLELSPGEVTASVQGSRRAPYSVRITVPVLPEAVWTAVEGVVAGQALFAAQLLGGELPGELEDVVAAAGGALFPRSFDEMTMHCSCPDWGMPCKHLAAAFYLLAESFDDDPFRILWWRGRSREQLLAGISGTVTDDTVGEDGTVDTDAGVAGIPGPGPGAGPGSGPGAAGVLTDLPATGAEESVERFWVCPVPLPARPPTLDAPGDLLLRQMSGPSAALGGAALATALDDAYRTLTGE
jgi:uncharacterized Zn finger protein